MIRIKCSDFFPHTIFYGRRNVAIVSIGYFSGKLFSHNIHVMRDVAIISLCYFIGRQNATRKFPFIQMLCALHNKH